MNVKQTVVCYSANSATLLSFYCSINIKSYIMYMIS
ncbi:hypothetical protein T02_2442 [Trichinella nativa]|uniref:Uncharacterized protein n=1 Tax=Trichinella nativa TaxID=6335 RepID=A0A0V1KHY9_9BILA|nr:hypothetical protein T02_2442 [Trichinella nativa]